MENVVIEQLSEDRLRTHLWTFEFIGAQIVLSQYLFQARPSTRHKFRTESKYNRYDNGGLPIDKVPFPEDIQAKALQQVIPRIKVIKELRGPS